MACAINYRFTHHFRFNKGGKMMLLFCFVAGLFFGLILNELYNDGDDNE